MNPRTYATIAAALLVFAAAYLTPTDASADLIPTRIASCQNADEGDKCNSARGRVTRGTCVMSPCRGKDYSNGSPPEYYYYACLKCLTRNQRQDLEDRIESGEARDPNDLPQSKRERPDDGIEIITGRDGPAHFDPPDIADDDDDRDDEVSEEDETDAGPDAPSDETSAPDAGTDASVDEAQTPDASAQQSTGADAGVVVQASKPDEPTASTEPESDDPDHSTWSTNALVIAGSIGLGLLLVFFGFRNRQS